MLGINYTSRSQTRVDRLLRERELRKLNKNIHTDENDEADSRWNSSGSPEFLVEDEMGLAEVHEDEILEASPLISRTLRERFGASEGKPMKQRLLVVANRLPVSAFRRGEDSWSLEISAGGLVSALLGKCCEGYFLL